MRIRVTELRPGAVKVKASSLSPVHALARHRRLEVAPHEFIILDREPGEGDRHARLEAHAATGTQWETLEVEPNAEALVFQRELEIYFEVTECAFANARGNEGAAAFWTRLRLIPGDILGHPLLRWLSGPLDERSLCRALSGVLESFASRALAARLETFHYESLCQDALTNHLSGFHEEARVRDEVYRCSGLLFCAPITALTAAMPSVDTDVRRTEIRRMQDEARRTQLAEAMAQAAAQAAHDRAAHQAAMQRLQQEKAKELERLEQAKTKEEMRIALRLLQEQAEAAARAARADADRKAAEAHIREQQARLTQTQIEAARREMALKEEAYNANRRAEAEATRQLEGIEAHLRDQAKAVFVEMGSLREQLAVLQDAVNQLSTTESAGDDALTMTAQWRALDRNGEVIIPQLGASERLYTGAMLDVAVAVSREAWVYVLLKDSSGEWVSLVPDTVGMMGDMRKNHQEAGEIVVWPGVNRRRPDLPHWMLDKDCGYERFMVIASEEPFEPIAEIQDHDNNPPEQWTRGICNPVDMLGTGAAKPTTMNFDRALRLLTGNGRIAHECVVQHV